MESGSVVVDVPFESSVFFFVFLGGPKTAHVYEWVLISSGQMACVSSLNHVPECWEDLQARLKRCNCRNLAMLWGWWFHRVLRFQLLSGYLT